MIAVKPMNSFISQSIAQPSVFLPSYTYKLSSAELISTLFREDLFTCHDIIFKTKKKWLIIHNYICIVGRPDFHLTLYEKQSGKIETKKIIVTLCKSWQNVA